MSARRRTEPRKSPSQERSRQTVDAIIEAAAQVFERHGYAGGTTNRIAERAGVSIGSLYQYFPNKEAILAVLLERHVAEAERIVARVMEHVAESPHDLDAVLRFRSRPVVGKDRCDFSRQGPEGCAYPFAGG